MGMYKDYFVNEKGETDLKKTAELTTKLLCFGEIVDQHSRKDVDELLIYLEEEIAGEWWDESNAEKFKIAAVSMIEHGMSVELTKELLISLYLAVRDEYGD